MLGIVHPLGLSKYAGKNMKHICMLITIIKSFAYKELIFNYFDRWWKNIRWGEKLSFTRDRLVEHFLWALGFQYLPQFSHGRRTLARINCMLTTLDDVYDLYGTLDELELLANAVERLMLMYIPTFVITSFITLNKRNYCISIA